MAQALNLMGALDVATDLHENYADLAWFFTLPTGIAIFVTALIGAALAGTALAMSNVSEFAQRLSTKRG